MRLPPCDGRIIDNNLKTIASSIGVSLGGGGDHAAPSITVKLWHEDMTVQRARSATAATASAATVNTAANIPTTTTTAASAATVATAAMPGDCADTDDRADDTSPSAATGACGDAPVPGFWAADPETSMIVNALLANHVLNLEEAASKRREKRLAEAQAPPPTLSAADPLEEDERRQTLGMLELPELKRLGVFSRLEARLRRRRPIDAAVAAMLGGRQKLSVISADATMADGGAVAVVPLRALAPRDASTVTRSGYNHPILTCRPISTRRRLIQIHCKFKVPLSGPQVLNAAYDHGASLAALTTSATTAARTFELAAKRRVALS